MKITDEARQAAMDALALVPLPPSVHLGNVVATVLSAAEPHLLAGDDTSDGFHTVGELYHHRMLLTAGLFGLMPLLSGFHPHKSWRHSDGELCFGGDWFIVVAQLPTGQISYHYPAEHWDLFRVADLYLPAPYDGHSPQDVVDRMTKWLEG